MKSWIVFTNGDLFYFTFDAEKKIWNYMTEAKQKKKRKKDQY